MEGCGQPREVELADLDLAPDAKQLVLDVITSGGDLRNRQFEHGKMLRNFVRLVYPNTVNLH